MKNQKIWEFPRQSFFLKKTIKITHKMFLFTYVLKIKLK